MVATTNYQMPLSLKINTTMKNFRYTFFICCFLIVSNLSGKEVPYLSGRINDYASVLSNSGIQQLEQYLKQHEDKTTNQLAVLIVPDLEGDNLEDFAERVFQTWRLGQQGEDNGALLLIAINDKKIRIEVGYGLEPYLTDAISGRIIQNVIAPYFRQGDYEGGV